MLYTIRHITRFRYTEPVRESVMEVVMQPRAEGNQRLMSFALQTTPRAAVHAYNDHLGNIVHHFDVLRPHSELLIEAQSQVEVSPPAEPPAAVGPGAWLELAPSRLAHEEFDMLAPIGIARPTERLKAFVEEHKLGRRGDPLSTMRAFSNTVHDAFEYDTKATSVDSPIDQALEMGRGVCQDFSHILLACARGAGHPGALRLRLFAAARRRRQTAGAGRDPRLGRSIHSRQGWIGFDPTNGGLAGDRHIRVAVGLDYNDVPPTRGVFKGKGESELAFAVFGPHGRHARKAD